MITNQDKAVIEAHYDDPTCGKCPSCGIDWISHQNSFEACKEITALKAKDELFEANKENVALHAKIERAHKLLAIAKFKIEERCAAKPFVESAYAELTPPIPKKLT